MSAPERQLVVDPEGFYPIDGTVRGWLVKVNDECARFDVSDMSVAICVDTPRGQLVAHVKVAIVQPLPRVN